MPPLIQCASFKVIFGMPPVLDPGGGFAGNTYVQELSGFLNVRGSYATTLRTIGADAKGNLFAAGSCVSASGLGLSDALLIKSRNDGTPVWQKRVGSVAEDSSIDVVVDAFGNVYTVGTELSNAPVAEDAGVASASDFVNSTGREAVLTKYNTNGDVMWCVRACYYNTGAKSYSWANGHSVAVAADGVYMAYRIPYTMALIEKRSAQGTNIWSKSLSVAPQSTYERIKVATDSSNNLFVLAVIDVVANARDAGLVMKTDASGARLWANFLVPTATTGELRRYDLCVDSLNQVSIVGDYSPTGSNRYMHLERYDNSGTLIWHKIIYAEFPSGVHSENLVGNAIAVDAAGNTYTSGTRTTTTATTALVLKFDNSGNLVWQKEISRSGLQVVGFGVYTDTSYVYVTGSTYDTSGEQTIFTAKIPASGNTTLNNFTITDTALTCAEATTRTDVTRVNHGTSFASVTWTVNTAAFAATYDTHSPIVRNLPITSTPLGMNYSVDNAYNRPSYVFEDGSFVLSCIDVVDQSRAVLVRCASDGTEMWRFAEGGVASERPDIGDVFGDSQGNVYTIMYNWYAPPAGSYLKFYIQKISPEGTMLWQAQPTYKTSSVYRASTYLPAQRNIAVDDAGSVFIAMTYKDRGGTNAYTCQYVKITSSGTVSYSGIVGGSWNTGSDYVYGPSMIVRDLVSDGTYQYLATTSDTAFTTTLYKLASDRTTVWSKTVGYVPAYTSPLARSAAVAVDAQGNVYFAVSTGSSTNLEAVHFLTIVKYSPDGVVQWDIAFSVPDLFIDFVSLTVSGGLLYMSIPTGIAILDAQGTVLNVFELDACGTITVLGDDLYLRHSLGISKYSISQNLSGLSGFEYSVEAKTHTLALGASLGIGYTSVGYTAGTTSVSKTSTAGAVVARDLLVGCELSLS